MEIDPLLHKPGDIVDATLFGDGFIGYSAHSERGWARLGVPGLRVLAQHEIIIPDTLDEMTWTLGPTVVAAAFGPGLTATGLVLEKIGPH